MHLVSHTHDDLGWLKTIDEYFEGSKQYIYDATVELILDGVVSELYKDPNKKFIYVEVAFFKMWYNN